MTGAQLYFAIGVPILTNAALIGVLIAFFNAKIDVVRAELHRVEEVMDKRLKHLGEMRG